MKTLDVDLCSIQEARDLVRNGKEAANQIAYFRMNKLMLF